MVRRVAVLVSVLLALCAASWGASCSQESPGKPAANKKTSGTGSGSRPKSIAFTKYRDKSEDAFTVLVPKGWQTEGGIVRVDPNAAGGAAQSIEAKFDFTVKKDEAGTVMIRWLPLMYFADVRGTAVESLFAPGSNYNGMMVMPYVGAKEFITRILFPYLRPGASDVRWSELKSLPSVSSGFKSALNLMNRYMPIKLDFAYDAAMGFANYEEGGVKYRELMVVCLENRGRLFGGQWDNRLTVVARTPASEYKYWEPVGRVITDSVKFNPKWIAGEIQGQIKRGEISIETQREIEKLEREITENRRKTNAEISEGMYLNLTGQDDYVNPFTGKVERDTSEWQNRWVNERGDIVYSDVSGYNPNDDQSLSVHGFKRARAK